MVGHRLDGRSERVAVGTQPETFKDTIKVRCKKSSKSGFETFVVGTDQLDKRYHIPFLCQITLLSLAKGAISKHQKSDIWFSY